MTTSRVAAFLDWRHLDIPSGAISICDTSSAGISGLATSRHPGSRRGEILGGGISSGDTASGDIWSGGHPEWRIFGSRHLEWRHGEWRHLELRHPE